MKLFLWFLSVIKILIISLVVGVFAVFPQVTNKNKKASSFDTVKKKDKFISMPWRQNELRFGLESGRINISGHFFSEVTLQHSLEMFLENYYDYAIYQLPAMGGYSYPDNYVFSLLGNSWLWNRYYFNELNINDPFFSGYSLHKMPMLDRSLEIDALTGKLYFHNLHKGKQGYGSLSTGYLGSNIPYYKVFNDPYSQQSPQLRERPPTQSRRRNRLTFEAFSKYKLSIGEGNLWLESYINIRDRVINDFDEHGNASPYTETFFQLSFNGEWKNPNKKHVMGWLATYISRDALNSEFYFRRQETARLDDFAVSGYYYNHDKLRHGHILNFNYKKIKRHNQNFSRNLFDVTGEGLDPFFPSVEIYSLSQHSYLGYGFDIWKQDFIDIRVDARNTVNILTPVYQSYFNPVYFKSPNDYLALYVTDWIAKPFAYVLFDNRGEVTINRNNEGGFQAYVDFGVSLTGIGINQKSLVRVRPYFTLGMNILNGFFGSTRQQLRVEIGRVNIPFSNKLALFVSDLYNSGKNYVWNDNDEDAIVDSGEKTTQLHSTTGGRYHKIDDNLNQPHYYYLDIPYNIDFNENWSLSIAAHYRIFKDQLWIRYQNADTSGTRVNSNGTSVYVPSLGEKRYVVYNLPSSKFPDNANWFNDSPFYMGVATKVTAVGEWYFFSLSFGAYLVNGITTLGNGPLHNSQGTLSELMADPNANFRKVGRLDADRAYVGKLLLAFRFIPEFIGVVDFKYRDGQPIGQWNYYVHKGRKQISFLRNSVSGDNILLYKGEFGTREDAIMSLDLRFKYTLDLNRTSFKKDNENLESLEFGLNIYNLIDIGRELAEFSFFRPGDANRNALELQVPRGIEFTIRYRY